MISQLYPDVRPRVKQSFKGVKVLVVPKQSLTLKEVLKRFVRRESLPMEKQGIYADTGYDLEKVVKQDMVDQMEVLQEVKASVIEKRKRAEDLKPRPPASPDPVPPSSPPPA